MSESVQEQVFKIIAEHGKVDVGQIKPESTLKDLNIASLEAIEIIFDIEEHFDITMPDRDPNFDTDSAQGLVDAVNEALAGKQDEAGGDA
jgi:acyl carrier protein